MTTPTAPTEPQAPPGLDDLSARDLLDVASTRRRARRLAEVDEMLVAAQWAVLHGQPQDDRDPMTHPGGDGTPDIREYCLAELAMAHETHHLTARSLIADTLDLIHRLPRTWAIVQAGDCEPWVARRVAVMTRPLLADTVGLVDRAVARAIAGHAPTTVFAIARAKIIEADPETHAAERERIRHERYVRLSRADEYGYRHLIARVTAGDATWIDAMTDRVADILTRTHGHDHNHDELRSLALGWLARPVDLLKLLLEHTQPESPTDSDEEGRPAWAPAHLADTVSQLCALPARTLASLRGRGHLYVHVTDQALRTRTGIARVEGLGPLDVTQLADLLGHADITVQPVLDLRDRRRTDAYEHPEATKDHVWTQTGGDVFPSAPAPPPATASTSTTAPPTTPPDHPARPDPTTAAPSDDATTAGRPTAATAATPSAPADTSGRPPTDSATSSTTPAPAASTTPRPTSSSPHPKASRSTSRRRHWSSPSRSDRTTPTGP